MGKTWRGAGRDNEIIHESRSIIYWVVKVWVRKLKWGPLGSLKNFEIQVCLLMVLG